MWGSILRPDKQPILVIFYAMILTLINDHLLNQYCIVGCKMIL